MKCGPLWFICATFPQPAAWGSPGFIQARKTAMTRNDCARATGDVERESAGWLMESMFLNPVTPAAGPAATELPLKEYLHARRRLTYEAMHFPLGFPARILSNSPRVME